MEQISEKEGQRRAIVPNVSPGQLEKDSHLAKGFSPGSTWVSFRKTLYKPTWNNRRAHVIPEPMCCCCAHVLQPTHVHMSPTFPFLRYILSYFILGCVLLNIWGSVLSLECISLSLCETERHHYTFQAEIKENKRETRPAQCLEWDLRNPPLLPTLPPSHTHTHYTPWIKSNLWEYSDWTTISSVPTQDAYLSLCFY